MPPPIPAGDRLPGLPAETNRHLLARRRLTKDRYGHVALEDHLVAKDPGERDLPQAGDAVFFDPEDDSEIRTDSAGLRTEYRKAVDDAVRSWRLECRRMGADYHLFTTDTPLGVVLGEYLEKRSRLG